MSEFTDAEIEYMREQTLARLATVGRDGQPHVTPTTYHFNADEDAIDVGGIFFGGTKKWRDVKNHRKVTLLVDDTRGAGESRQARAMEVRGTVELHEIGGDQINPRFPNFAPQFIRIRPTRIVSWGIDQQADATGLQMNARSVS